MLEAVEKGKTTNKYVFGAYKAIQLVTVRRLFLIPTRLHYNQVIWSFLISACVSADRILK